MVCRHCGQERKRTRPLGLCWTCYYAPGVRALYPSTSKFTSRRAREGHTGEPSDEDLDAACEAMLSENPLWKPCPYYPSDSRYNAVVAAREAAGLPARHPGDRPPDPD